MAPNIFLYLCFATSLGLSHCESRSYGDDERARLPELITELDLAGLEASEEDIEALKSVVKRLAPEKNGVMGQPGVDFPALTTIPATTFSCRGSKGGYYADLETNCQVFHICDNGRKISFLCPNGTIFQQSQLICDWWFKVDCSKSTDLYEQSAERLAEDERKRTEAKRINSEFHRSSAETNDDERDSAARNYYRSENSNYDGRQNGRTDPFGRTFGKNEVSGGSGQQGRSTDFRSNTRGFDPNLIYGRNEDLRPNRYDRINDLVAGNALKSSLDVDGRRNEQSDRSPPGDLTFDRGNYRSNDGQRNQLVDTANDEAKRRLNYEDRGASTFPGSRRDNNHKQQQRPVDHSFSSRNVGRENERRNFGKSVGNVGGVVSNSNRATPSYTETTTFRTSTFSPIKEYQQLAESAAFATNRGNRFNEPYSSSQFNAYYGNNNANGKGKSVQQRKTEKPRRTSVTSETGSANLAENVAALPFTTVAESINKTRTSNDYDKHGTTTLVSTIADTVTTTWPSYTPDWDTESNEERTSYTDSFDHGTTTSYPTSEDSRITTETPDTEIFTEDYPARSSSEPTMVTNFFDNTTPTVVSSVGYANAKAYTGKKDRPTFGNNESSVGNSDSARLKSRDYKEKSVPKSSTNESIVRRSDPHSSRVTTPTSYREVAQLPTSKTSTRTRISHRQSQNFLSPSTEKSSRTSTATVSQGGLTGKTLSPYDTSFTYQQGKVMSTLGPYVPFTKNYVYSTAPSTTIKPTVKTIYRSTTGNPLDGRIRMTGGVSSGSAAYLPENKSHVSTYSPKKHNETELGGTRSGPNVPTSSGPSTLHSLALYFATASDDFDVTAESRTDSAADAETAIIRGIDDSARVTKEKSSVELPTSILTRHTINSYAELFNLNNALEANSSINDTSDVGRDVASNEDDLDIQQSEGPVEAARRSNGTRLRELAQVFTHALSAYLRDPDTFKKILTDIRPTEPSLNTDNEERGFTATTFVPTTYEDYPSVTKEKDEVLDFSDDAIPPRGRTTIYPVTTTDPPTTTNVYGTFRDNSNVSKDNFASRVNDAFRNDGNEPKSGDAAPVYYPELTSGQGGASSPLGDYNDNYFPIDESNDKIGGFRNDTRSTTNYEPYGKRVKPFDATPISDNYVSSSTPSTYYVRSYGPRASESRANSKDRYNGVSNELKASSNFRQTDVTRKLKNFVNGDETDTVRSRYHENENDLADDVGNTDKSIYFTSSVTTRTVEPFTAVGGFNTLTNRDERTTIGDVTDVKSNRHWTSSPTVTQLWESTVFVEPERINEGLVSGTIRDSEYSTIRHGESTESSAFPNDNNNKESLVTDATSSGISSRKTNNFDNPSSPWKWSSTTDENENDSPTAFTLFPRTSYSTSEQKIATATPLPLYTTRSSITTTITSSVTSTSSNGDVSSPRDNVVSRREKSSTEREISHDDDVTRAQEMFGKLNATSTETLMRVMKQADSNATVRQLVLLLINHCNGPMNKTMEEEKEQLLDALLRMPVNEFTFEESRELVAGINRLSLPIGKNHFTTTVEPPVTTFRSKKAPKFKSNNEETRQSGAIRKNDDIATAESGNALSSDDGSASDARALELLRSLYTIAAKWG